MVGGKERGQSGREWGQSSWGGKDGKGGRRQKGGDMGRETTVHNILSAYEPAFVKCTFFRRNLAVWGTGTLAGTFCT